MEVQGEGMLVWLGHGAMEGRRRMEHVFLPNATNDHNVA
jgi:hypothetical protein